MNDDLSSLGHARGDIAQLQQKIADLQRRIDKQAVLLRALFLLLRDQGNVSEEKLLERFQECEAWRNKSDVVRCRNCGRTVNMRHNRCLYCNEPCRVQSAFELIEAGVWPEPMPKESATEDRFAAGTPNHEGIKVEDD
jgi:hypothetical protein